MSDEDQVGYKMPPKHSRFQKDRSGNPEGLDCSKRRVIVLDAFAGTRLVSAERTGRHGYGVELDPHHCDVIVRRLATVAALEAIHAKTGRTFTEIEAARATEADSHLDSDDASAAPAGKRRSRHG